MSEDTNNDTWLKRASDAYEASTTYVDANYRRQWEDDIRAFNSEHPAGSKYHSEAYKYRSKIFRPKTRSVIRNNEAAAMAAFFSNMDVITVEPEDENDQVQNASADVWHEVMNYRLQKTIPWFVTCIGALQDAQVTGVVCSKQYWSYVQIDTHQQALNPYTGEPMLDDQMRPVLETVKEVIEDKPIIDLYPVENVRISPAAKWYDPINTSPYVILLHPMYVMDVKERMSQEDPKTGQPKWIKADDAVIRQAMTSSLDSTRQTREQNRQDPTQEQNGKELSDFDVVWAHEVFMRVNGRDMVYWTLGTSHRLTEPKPVSEVYRHAKYERPIVMGSCEIETHKIYQSGTARIGHQLQKETNELANSRLDNIKLVLNKRYKVKRGKQVDLKSLVRNAAGSVTMVNDQDDVETIEFNDVTGSSYAEQDRINADYDELLGFFGAGTVQTNRKMNETVGGMAMLRSNAGSMTEFLLRVFAETWVEPVMRQLLRMEQAYETDTVILTLAAGKAKLAQTYGMDELTDEVLDQELSLSVNVGGGATDPIARTERFLYAVGKIAEIASTLPPGMDINEISQEVFGRLGYKDGRRFWVNQDQHPAVMQLQQTIQQLQQELESKNAELENKIVVQQIKEQGQTERQREKTDADLIMEALKQEGAMDIEDFKAAIQIMNTALTQMSADNEAQNVA